MISAVVDTVASFVQRYTRPDAHLDRFVGCLAVAIGRTACWTYIQGGKAVYQEIRTGELVFILGQGEDSCFKVLTRQGSIFDISLRCFGRTDGGLSDGAYKWFEILPWTQKT